MRRYKPVRSCGCIFTQSKTVLLCKTQFYSAKCTKHQ